jgi:hypothetical protein
VVYMLLPLVKSKGYYPKGGCFNAFYSLKCGRKSPISSVRTSPNLLNGSPN